MTETTYLLVDAFADQPFTGNPAAVCLLEDERDAVWMQLVAAELNLSETAFIHPMQDMFSLRWFTPTVEVDLCGHATLASAHSLWEQKIVPSDTSIRFETRSGILTCRKDGQRVELDLPAAMSVNVQENPLLNASLGAKPKLLRKAGNNLLAVLTSEKEVRSVTPDFARLADVASGCVIVTARSDSNDIDFVSRCFGPAVGINEDPVTGSAHCCLGPFWSERLEKKEMTGFQASARGGTVHVRLDGDRVLLAGGAVTVSKGTLLV